MSFRYAVLLSYNGARYWGWQKQTQLKGPTLQEEFEKTLASITQETVAIVASGRTDSGVHAIGQVLHFTLKKKLWDPNILERALNSRLHLVIRVLKVLPVDETFHAQRSAIKKQYSYYFQQGASSLPFLEPYSYWIRKNLDVKMMNRAIQALRGEHDFKPFQASGGRPVKTVRKIFEAEVVKEKVQFPECPKDFYLVRVRVVGTGFLKQMVRGIAGTLLQVGEGRRDPQCFKEILRLQDRSLLGPTAPGKGLWLEKVWYPKQWGI